MARHILMRIIYAASLLLALIVTASSQQKFDTYSNARFGYEIAYPNDLVRSLSTPDNGDGQIFRSKNKSAELYVWGQYNALGHTLEYEYLFDQRKRKNIGYKALLEDGYIIWRNEKGKIYYQRTILLGKDGDTAATLATFVFSYPASQKTKFDPIVKRVSNSFKFN
jgi:hypothetical protein